VSESSYLSGGPVDQVFARLRDFTAHISVEWLQVKHPGADDDNLWFIRLGNDAATEVQIETAANGEPPFLIEGMADNQRLRTSDIDEAAATIEHWLRH